MGPKDSNAVKGYIEDVKKQIQADLQRQALSGPVVDNRNISLVTPNVSFSFSENEGLFVGFLKSVIGGTQGNSADMVDFKATIDNYNKETGGTAAFRYKLHSEICDDFGVDFSDIIGKSHYRQPFNPLIPFWLLQHHTDGPKPFVNKLVVETDTITGTFTIPPGYEETDVLIAPLSTVPGFGTDPSVYYRFIVDNGLAYAGSGNQLRVVDMASGNLIQSLVLPGSGTLTGFAREGNHLYAFLSGSDTFSVIDIANESGAFAAGQRSVSIASSDVGLFVGNGVAWLAGSGLRTPDVTNPTNPTVIQTPTGSQFFTARRIALNGSGLGLLTPDGGNFVISRDRIACRAAIVRVG